MGNKSIDKPMHEENDRSDISILVIVISWRINEVFTISLPLYSVLAKSVYDTT